MKKTYTFKITALALIFGAGSMHAIAQDTDEITGWQTPLAAEFSSLDTTGNGLLLPYEASKNKAFNKKTFAQADANHDGTIDQDEYIYYKTGSWPAKVQPNVNVSTNLESSNDLSEPQDTMVVAEQSSVGTVVDDSIITTKAKASLLADQELKSLQISVETHQGEVILSGFVDSEEAKMKAEQVVTAIGGVKSVNNSLVVKN
jgi:hyperosmotically inducible periplasmic protein